MIVAIGTSRKDIKWHNTEVGWEQFLARLRDPFRSHETVRQYQAMDKEARAAAKDIGGFVGGALTGGRRKADTVRDRCLVTLDLDDAGPRAWEDTALWGYRCCCYSTHSHTEEHPRLRVIFPLDRPATVEEYGAVARKVASWVGIEQMDPSTYEPSRLMYWPSCPSDGEYIFREQEGPVLTVEEVLQEYGPDDAWHDTRLWPAAKSEPEIRVREARHQGNPTEKPGIVGLFCRAYDVPAAISAFLPETYTEGSAPGRLTYARGTTADGAVLYEDGAFLYSHHGTDPCGGQLVNAFDLVRIHKFGDLDDKTDADLEITRRPSYKAMCDFAAADPGCKRQLADERQEEAEAKFGDLEGDGDAWKEQLQVNRKTGEADSLNENAILILRNDPKLSGRFGINEFSYREVVRAPLPWHTEVSDHINGDPWGDSDDAGLRTYMEMAWKLKGRNNITDAYLQVIEENKFHPVREYLTGLVWDGTDRLDTMLVRWMGAEDTPYVRAISRKWAVAAVRRIMEPGCKFDTMLVLEGEQGCGKSQFAAVMSRGYFTDSVVNIGSKDAFDQIRGRWIVEMSELAATRKAENEQIKAFYSKQTDSFRPAYAKHVGDYPRMCVFIGTTNDPEFIRDLTGGRRFWPVHCGAERETVVERLDGLRTEVDQLWAEAVVRYRGGEKTYEDTDTLLTQAREAQAEYQQQDPWIGMISEFLDKPIPGDWASRTPEQRRDFFHGEFGADLAAEKDRETASETRDKTCIAEVWNECFGFDDLDRNSNSLANRRRVIDILNNLPGWEHTRKTLRFGPYGTQKAYQRKK